MAKFNPDCALCARLSDFRKTIKRQYPEYFARPVPAFGDSNPRLLIVGLAPGLHGANATGRPFTGDYAGILLYNTLYETGFSNKAESVHRDDGLQLRDCRITNAVKCVPPQNKPVPAEINCCNQFLRTELEQFKDCTVILALGRIAHQAVVRTMELKQAQYPFEHAREHNLPCGRILIDSYHCSRYNTQTRRLTEDMFRSIFRRIRNLLDA